jgi:hypothetical protein
MTTLSAVVLKIVILSVIAPYLAHFTPILNIHRAALLKLFTTVINSAVVSCTFSTQSKNLRMGLKASVKGSTGEALAFVVNFSLGWKC